MTRTTTLLLTSLFALGVCTLAPAPQAHAQRLGDLTTRNDDDPEFVKKRDAMMFKAGSVDALLGIGGFFYPHIEPGLEVGVLNLPGDVTVGVGANLDIGYCLGCLLFDLVDDISGSDYETEIRSWYVAPQLRVLVHLGFIGRIAKMPELDVYGGFGAGPALWRFSIEVFDKTNPSDSAEAGYTSLAGFGGPLFGLRYMLSESFFASLEARYFISVASQNTSVNVGGSNVAVNTQGTINDRYGGDYSLSIGFRF